MPTSNPLPAERSFIEPLQQRLMSFKRLCLVAYCESSYSEFSIIFVFLNEYILYYTNPLVLSTFLVTCIFPVFSVIFLLPHESIILSKEGHKRKNSFFVLFQFVIANKCAFHFKMLRCGRLVNKDAPIFESCCFYRHKNLELVEKQIFYDTVV